MGGACNTHARDMKRILSFDRKSKGKRPFGRDGRKCNYDIKMDVKK
jgi:hypothetical protein